jgi:O-antigen ligase
VSGSRAGTVAAVIAVVATIALLPKLRSRLPYVLPLAGMALVPILLFTSVGRSILHQLRLGGSSSSSSTSGSNYQRSLVNQVAWVQFKSRPLGGVGFGIMPGPHDIFLELLAAGGVIAMASFLTFIGGLAACLRRALSGPLREEAIACGIAVFAWLANGAFDNQVADKYLYLVPGLLFAIGRTSWLLQSESRQPPVVAVERRPALAPSHALPAALR